MSPERIGDMDPKSRLRIYRDAEGDIIVQVLQFGPQGLLTVSEVEYCTIPAGGGRSPNTFDALLKLIEAMDRDNRISKLPSELYNPRFDSEPE